MHRAHLTAQERAFRSRLAQLIHEQPLLHATLNPRQVTCGKAGCRCQRGEKHPALYLVCTVAGKKRQMYVPPALEQEVRQWVANYQSAQELLDKLSEQTWQKLRARKEESNP